ncbi:Gfo/Idh/MocA family protein [Bifidobacterium mongoliense]|jgi:predicted dehydrogenase|uniref:Gfo/Idh/MocA family protein n=1 Tax=Bifidobacterium mongoliense TaxID=518643 RepID=UPI0026483DD6|nr:Gfo/Idh/MocA family oxidoreductase [Bifidobacterium mongoliense]MDN6768996.1 Gfo/Idh/MocA family oxidoreductase [Bifidobacterium mongoliense]MDN6783236.1 Gfo/Idh/MocA family oxidoreductase [Bifidobacterium mongoliense]MDN6802284.1 Gfo/Idh/MocA family oxidoreductase [Bifidobacterium mongoliense]MDY3126180.1 Gfo/Idh/MocA family oxidoreductase [Bifidobacterium mongoliense]
MSTLNGKRAEAQQQGRKIKVAILGAGGIAHAMALTLNRMADDPRYTNLVEPYAVAARDGERAADFARQYGLPVSYGSYEEMLADPEVDLVYIATPHSLHAEQGEQCLRAGKNILVEKSFTANTAQAERLLATARETGLLCTEAIWTRYMPSRTIIHDLLASGIIGEIRTVSANLGYTITGKARLTDPALAGGALLDVGVYPLNFVDMILEGRPYDRMATAMTPYQTGVDAQSTTTLFYPDTVMAVAYSSMVSISDRDGVVWGTDGHLICRNINDISAVDVYDRDYRLVKHVDMPEQLTGYEYEVASAANAILDGARECPEAPHTDTLRIMRLMDDIRGQWGLRFPFEQE